MSDELTTMTAEIVSAYVAGNTVPTGELSTLIQSVFKSLSTLGEPAVEAKPELAKLTAGQIRKSITSEALISFEDGRSYKTLKRHLTTKGLTIAEYKAKWGLPSDYPTTAPSYSEARSAMAKSLGLGNQRKAPVEAAPVKAPRKPRTPKAAPAEA